MEGKMNPLSISEEKKNELIKLASLKLQKSESELKEILGSGKADRLMDKIPDQQKEGIMKLLNDPKKLEATLNSPIIKKLLSDYLAKGK